MKAAVKSLLGMAIICAVVLVARAEDEKKEEKKTLKGEIGCPKCVFKIEKTCGTAIKVKEGDKEVIYVVDDKRNKEKYHGKICTGTVKGSVTGVITKKDDKLIIKPEKDGVKFED